MWQEDYDFQFFNNDFAGTGGDPETFSEFDKFVSETPLNTEFTIEESLNILIEKLNY